MWPGQQPPGGEQNPQDPNQNAQNPNPYQQPGYHQPNPYQQPGYGQQQPGYQQPGYGQQPNPYQQQPQQPNPYQQPTPPPGYPQQDQTPQPWATQPGPPQPPPGDGKKKRTAVIAIVLAVCVVAAAAVTGVFLLGKDDKKDTAEKDGKKSATPSQPAQGGQDPGEGREDQDNPRSDDGDPKPVIPGWKVVVNSKRHNAFDVPADWTVKSEGWSTGFSDDKNKPLVAMSGPAYAKPNYCTVTEKNGYKNTNALAGTGTKGAMGAKSEGEAALNEAKNWVYAAYDQKQTGKFKYPKKATPFKSDHGLKGYTAWATVTGVKKTDKCTTDGKSFTVTYTDTNGDFATWVLYTAKGVKDEISDSTIKKIMSTLRPLESSSTR